MTNVINSSTKSALSSNVHVTSIAQQPDDLLPSLAALTFTVTHSGEPAPVSAGVSLTGSSPLSLDCGALHANDDSLDAGHSPHINNNSIDAQELKKHHIDSGDLLNHSADMLTILTSPSPNNIASVSPSSIANAQAPISTPYEFATTKHTDDNGSVGPLWPPSGLDDATNHAVASNGFKPNSGYPNAMGMLNNTSMSVSLQQQQQRRAITASHGGGFQQGLPPNNCGGRNMPAIQSPPSHHAHSLNKASMPDHQTHHFGMHPQAQQQPPQQQHHHHSQLPHQHQPNMNFHQSNAMDRDPHGDPHRHQPHKPAAFNSNYPVWSNPPSASMPWQENQQHHNHHRPALNNSIPVSIRS